MRRTHSFILALLLGFSLTACEKRSQTTVRRSESGTAVTVNTPDKKVTVTVADSDEGDEQERKTTSAGTPIDEDFNWNNVSMTSTPESSCFSEIGYDSRNEVLVVTFWDSGSSYAYYDVPEEVWDDLCSAKSKGGFYNSDIKGEYYCEKLG